MASLTERLNNDEYKFWIKAGLCLRYLKEGLETFAEERSKRTHSFVKISVKEGAPTKMQNVCDNAKVIKTKQGWTLGCCNDCKVYIKEIIKLAKDLRFEVGNWDNSDVKLWPKEPWEMMKVYMNKGQKPFEQQKSAKETDLSGMLNYISNCYVPWLDIQNVEIITKVREARNSTFHSASMKMSEADFVAHTKAMVALLEDPMSIKKTRDAQAAVKNIQQISQPEFSICSIDEYLVLSEKTTLLQEQNIYLQQEVRTLKNKYMELETSIDLMHKTTQIQIETEASQRQQALDNLRAKIDEKEKQIKELSTELILVKKLVNQDKELYNKMDVRVTNVETTLEKTQTEFGEVKKSHYSLVEQVHRIQNQIDRDKHSGSDSTDQTNISLEMDKLDKLKMENTLMKDTLHAKRHENEELKNKNKALEQQIANLKYADSDAQIRIQLLTTEKKNKDLTDKNAKLTAKIQRLQSDPNDDSTVCTKETCKSRIEALEYENDMLKKDNNLAEVKMSLQLFEKRNTDLEVKKEKLRSQLEKSNIDIKALETKLQEEKNRTLQLDQQIQQLNVSIDTISSEREAQTKMYQLATTDFISQINKLKRDAAAREIELENKHTETKVLTTENEKLERVFNQVKADIEILEFKKTQLENELIQQKEKLSPLEEENTRLKEAARDVTTDNDIVIPTEVNVKLQDDDATPWVTGAEFITNGDVVICDSKNERIILYSQSFDVKGSIELHDEPWDVTELDSSKVVVTLPFAMRIIFVQIQPSICEKEAVDLDAICRGIQVHNGEIYATYITGFEEGGVMILDIKGNVIRNIDTKTMYVNPQKLAIDKEGRIVVSDNGSHCVTVMDQEGVVIRQFKIPELQNPGGVCHDRRENIIVCGSGSNNVLVFSAGKKLFTIRMPKNPISVSYRQEDDILLVGFDSNKLMVVELKELYKNEAKMNKNKNI